MGPPTNRSASDQAYAEGEITDTERGIFGSVSMAEVLSFFSEYARKLGTAPWAERARTELRASGETARKRDPSTLFTKLGVTSTAELTTVDLHVQ